MSKRTGQNTEQSKGGPNAGQCQTIIRPDDMDFRYHLRLPGGKVIEFAYLQGDPSKPGPYTLRALLPPNATQPPHFHHKDEYGVVISGTYYTGDGNVVDRHIKPLPVGTFGFIPAECHHYAFTKNDCAVVEVHGEGPWEMILVDPNGNPVGDPVTLPPARPPSSMDSSQP